MLTGNEIRQKFIDYFKNKLDHVHLPSSSLVPENPTVLLTPAGMLQFVPIFLGYSEPPNPPRAVTYQKCARAGGKDSDIENVGRTPRHHTFFEMLGNFSFGDYFKNEIIPWSWEFVTNELKLDPERLWITVYKDDEESLNIWKDKVGVPENRIIKCGKKDNFWGPPGPTGPCGPCTEIHYDLGTNPECGDKCIPNDCNCDRFVEIWNLVLMELFLDEEGNYSPLAKKNVDTGMGLERIAMAVQGKLSTFETDLISPILEEVCKITNKTYNVDKNTDVSLRIITDHARCVTFMVSDGIIPGNVGRNYVLRMILRRALRHGKILGLSGTFLYNLVDTVIELYKEAYPELLANRTKIIDIIKTEEERFEKTIDRGMGILDDLISKTISESSKIIPGKEAFTLYDTYGFPLELTVEIAQEKGLSVNIEEFNICMKEQKERAKQAHVSARLTDDLVYVDIIKQHGATKFNGYEQLTDNAIILKILKEGKLVDSAIAGEYIELILDNTVFYAESGGQIGDTGLIETDRCSIEVINTFKYENLYIHQCEVRDGSININDKVQLNVDATRRENIARHHTATHLLHSALKKVLGNQVNQAGSFVGPDRARFDFSFNKALTDDQIKKIETYINTWISDDYKCITDVMTADQAKTSGAIALFGEKYGDTVRVVSYGPISKELCGGTHIQNTAKISLCKIASESALAAGVRRVEIVCASSALDMLNNYESQIHNLSSMLKVPSIELSDRVEKLMDEIKSNDKKIKSLNAELALLKVDSLINNAVNVNSFKLISSRLDNMTTDALKSASEKLSDKLGDSIVVIGSVDSESGKVTIIVKVSDNLVKQSYNAGNIANKIAAICGGRGGGKPNFAQAGAKDAEKLDDALKSAIEIVKDLVKV